MTTEESSSPRGPSPDDVDLARMTQNGDVAAFEVLVNRYRRRAFLAAIGYLQSREDAMDAVQEAFFRAYRAIRKFDLERTFYPWFYKILKNSCMSRLRGRYRMRTRSIDHQEDERPWDIPDLRSAPETNLYRSEIRSRLKKALAELGPNDREIIVLQHFQECSYREIAEILDIPIGTVMSRLFHARRRLREKTEDLLNPGTERG